MDLEYKIDKQTWEEKIAILRLRGQLDKAFRPELDDALQNIIDDGYKNIAVDLSKLEYMSSSGIAALVNLRGKLDRVTGSICFFAANGRVDKVLHVMGMKRAYTFYSDETVAKNNFLIND